MPSPVSRAGLVALLLTLLAPSAARGGDDEPGPRSFLRLGTGLAYLYERWNPDGNAPGARYYGWGPVLDVAVGRTLSRPVVLGGELQIAGLFDREESYLGRSFTLGDTLHLVSTLTVFADYVSTTRPSLRAGGGLGLVAVSEIDTYMGGSQTSWGVVADAHLGARLLKRGRWSIGVLSRLSVYRYRTSEAPPAATTIGVLPVVLLTFVRD